MLLLAVSGILPPQGRNRHLESPAGSRGRSRHRKAPRRLCSGTQFPSGDRGDSAPNRHLLACPVPLRVKQAPTLVLRAMHGGFPRGVSPWPVTQSGSWLAPAGNIPATQSGKERFLALENLPENLQYPLLRREDLNPFPEFGSVYRRSTLIAPTVSAWAV